MYIIVHTKEIWGVQNDDMLETYRLFGTKGLGDIPENGSVHTEPMLAKQAIYTAAAKARETAEQYVTKVTTDCHRKYVIRKRETDYNA